MYGTEFVLELVGNSAIVAADVIQLKRIQGFSGVPITTDGKMKSKFVFASFKKEVVGEDGKVSFRWTAMHNCFNCKMPYHGFVCSGCEDCCGSDICHQLHLERDEGEQGE